MSELNDKTTHVAPPGPVRYVHGEGGTLWTVREVIATGYDRRESRSLVFMSDEIMRRVRNYPSDWAQWSEADLYALSLRT